MNDIEMRELGQEHETPAKSASEQMINQVFKEGFAAVPKSTGSYDLPAMEIAMKNYQANPGDDQAKVEKDPKAEAKNEGATQGTDKNSKPADMPVDRPIPENQPGASEKQPQKDDTKAQDKSAKKTNHEKSTESTVDDTGHNVPKPPRGKPKPNVVKPDQQSVSVDSVSPDFCYTIDANLEKHITRDKQGLVVHTAERFPRLSYDDHGQLTAVTVEEPASSILGKVLELHGLKNQNTYYQRQDGTWADANGKPSKYAFHVSQETGSIYMYNGDILIDKRADGTSLSTDFTSSQVKEIDNGFEKRSFHYDENGKLSSVSYRNTRGFDDSWVRQPDGRWLNFGKDGNETGRVLRDIQIHSDGTYVETTQYPCRDMVFRLERRKQ